MDAGSLSKESSEVLSPASPSNQTENDSDPGHSESPERPVNEHEVLESPASPDINDLNTDRRMMNPTSIPLEARTVDRENIHNGYLDPEEVMIQRHAMLNSSSMISYNNESTFNCKYPGCNFTSTEVEIYLKHEDTHIDGGSVLCDVCNTRFNTYATMRRHRLLHLGVRPFECQICSRRFLQREKFMEHLVKHSKQRPYRCPFCSKSFTFRPHLKSHLTAEHAGIIVDKSCHLCDYKASSPNGAKIHFAMCHLKQSMDNSDSDDQPQELAGNLQVNNSRSENGAIDLATVSQNFSFIQTAHYPHYPTLGESTAVPGPSDLSRGTKVIRVAAPIIATHPLIPQNVKQNIVIPTSDDDRRTCVSASAGSTTLVSPTTCQDKSCCQSDNHHPEFQDSRLRPRDKVNVKPEPPELAVDDSQNSSVQPTSTMDLSTTDIVETTCVTSEAAGSSEVPCRRKSHKHSSSEDAGSERNHSPPDRNCLDSQNAQNSKNVHTCYRYRQYDDSGSQRCREYSRHTCSQNNPEKRPRLSESENDRTAQNYHSDSEERKVFYNRATSTDSFVQAETTSVPRVVYQSSSLHNDGAVSGSPADPNYFTRKSTIAIRDIESCTLSCPYCGIIFPDQTLYLLHRSLHSESSPWKCNLCGKYCKDKYDFNSHVISKGHF